MYRRRFPSSLHYIRPILNNWSILSSRRFTLHPRAQYAMAEVLAEAAKDGKRIVIETHSSLLLMGIQTLVAEGKLPPELVKLHWFTLLADGSTNIDSANVDERGTFGNWSEDFDDVALYSEGRFLDAQARLRENIGGKKAGRRLVIDTSVASESGRNERLLGFQPDHD